MTATYVNRQFDGSYTYFDISFEENGEQLLRMGCAGFKGEPTIEEMETRVRDFASFNLSEYELTDIII